MAAASSIKPPSSPGPSSNSPNQQHPSQQLMAPPQVQALIPTSSTSTASRRLPPPCWSHEETEALIDSYRDKWYTLRRGNLRAAHWQDVADSVASLCPHSVPAKTSVQCRHKMEKLRKRYRSELQRARSIPNHKFSSSWVYFRKMDAMEKGPSSSTAFIAADSDGHGADYGNGNNYYVDEENDEYGDDDNYADQYSEDGNGSSYMFQNLSSKRGYNGRSFPGATSNGSGADGFRIRVPGSSPPQSGFRMKDFPKFHGPPPVATPNYHKQKYNLDTPGFDEGIKYSTRIVKNGSVAEMGSRSLPGLGKREREGATEVNEVVQAIQMLGDGFVKVEKMKMEMMREIEQMRMDMEMKRTEVILESQQRIIEAFVKGFSEKKNKKIKPES